MDIGIPHEEAKRPRRASDGEVIRVLVVEDDNAIRELLVVLLADEGYAVAAAVNGQVGLARCAAFHPDLVVLDLEMPVLGGSGFLSRRPAHNCAALIVVTSAGRLAGPIPGGDQVSAFIAKPFDITTFAMRIQAVLAEGRWQNVGDERATAG